MTSPVPMDCAHRGCGRPAEKRGMCNNHYLMQRKRLVAYGRWESMYVDGAQAKAHVDRLVAAGMPLTHLAAFTGLGELALQRIHARPAGQACQLARSTVDRLLAVRDSDVYTAYRVLDEAAVVDGTGSRRRLRALIAAGWTQRELAERCGWVYEGLNAFINDESKGLTAGNARRVAAVFAELQLHPGGSSTKSRRLAQRRGWAPPLAWDEESIDDPRARPDQAGQMTEEAEVDEITVERCVQAWRSNTTPPQVHHQDRIAVASALLAAGATVKYTSRVVGWTPPTLSKYLAEQTAA